MVENYTQLNTNIDGTLETHQDKTGAYDNEVLLYFAWTSLKKITIYCILSSPAWGFYNISCCLLGIQTVDAINVGYYVHIATFSINPCRVGITWSPSCILYHVITVLYVLTYFVGANKEQSHLNKRVCNQHQTYIYSSCTIQQLTFQTKINIHLIFLALNSKH